MPENAPDRLPQLPPRRRDILHAVIREHIASARPVASAALVQRYGLDVSSATVRNDLAALEELGLLTHPHTSAGRVPTDLGYRYFIDSLMPDPALRHEERVTVSHQFRQAPSDTTERLRLAASTLARLTAEAALATFDPAGDETAGMWSREVFYEGIDRILEQPEAEVRDHVREVVSLFHDRARLAQVLPRTLDEGDVAVAIGGEIAMEPLRSFSFVIGRYGRRDGAAGYVGIVGPRRMDYQRTIGAVRYVGELMTDLVRNFRSL
ncbi:MAG: DeoR family transcriptional regulator [Chloroflexi bacterium]|nr:DeoR family transcriptional regulator [Chloroflexota bacterium]